jgi:2'-5' RNA ligase
VSSERARVFLALPLGAELGRTLADAVGTALGRGKAGRAYSFPRPEGLHLTLLFLGDVERPVAARLWSEVEARAGGARAPQLALTSAGSFPAARGRERVLWIGVEPGDAPGLLRLRADALAAAEAVGLDVRQERARPFRAHVTVARPREARPRVPEAFYALRPALSWTPGELALLESFSEPGGSRYEPIARLALAAGDAR